jgi:hypothetical protein
MGELVMGLVMLSVVLPPYLLPTLVLDLRRLGGLAGMGPDGYARSPAPMTPATCV